MLPMNVLSDWLTTEVAADLSGFHVEYVRRLIRSGEIKGKKWGREWMVEKESLISYLKTERHPGPKPKIGGDKSE
jgi:excisionase family DNA binding protein